MSGRISNILRSYSRFDVYYFILASAALKISMHIYVVRIEPFQLKGGGGIHVRRQVVFILVCNHFGTVAIWVLLFCVSGSILHLGHMQVSSSTPCERQKVGVPNVRSSFELSSRLGRKWRLPSYCPHSLETALGQLTRGNSAYL